MTTPPTPTVAPNDLEQLKRALLALRAARARIDELERGLAEPIAIVGIGLRLPGGVSTPNAFWRLLAEGRDAIREVPADRWDIDQYYATDGAPGSIPSRFGGFLDAVDQFDPH